MQALYNELAEHYDEIINPIVDTETEVSFLHQTFHDHNVASVLDIACGSGRHSVALARLGYEVLGIDYSLELLKAAETKVKGSNPQFEFHDISHLKLARKFDAAICMWSTFGELPYEKLLKSLPKLLNTNGLFVIDTHYYSEYPTKEALRDFEAKLSDGGILQVSLRDTFKGNRRIRETANNLGGEIITDHSEMDILTEQDFISLLASYGFRHEKTYHDYGQPKVDPKRIQMVFLANK